MLLQRVKQVHLSWQQEMGFPCLDAGWQGGIKHQAA